MITIVEMNGSFDTSITGHVLRQIGGVKQAAERFGMREHILGRQLCGKRGWLAISDGGKPVCIYRE